MSNKGTALITGASMGLGAEFARLFARDGHDVVLVARSRDKLEALADELRSSYSVTAHVMPSDLVSPTAAANLFSQLQTQGIELDFLVNNAGFGTNGKFAELPLQRELDQLQVNINALVDLTHRALQGMLERGRGRILNIASTAGFQPGPLMSTYYASKSFVLMFTEGLASELKGTGVTATAHCPGATATHFAENAGNDSSILFKLSVADPKKVALHGYRSMMRGKVVAIEGLINWLAAFSVRFTPRAMIRWVTRRLNATSG